MELIQELENQFKTKSKTGTIQEKEKIAVDFLCGVDFKDSNTITQAEQYIRHILTDFVGKNEQITSLEAKIVHCMIAKISLDGSGLNDVKIKYVDRTEKDFHAGAYYRDIDNSINFFNNDVCNTREWTEPYGTKGNVEKGATSRLDYFAHEVSKLQHEIQHAVQFKNMSESELSPSLLTPESYVISRQYIARIFAKAQDSKYYKKGLDVDRLYNDNHDQFYYEIDADKHEIERTLEMLKTISQQAYQIATDQSRNTYLQKLKEKTEQLDNYSAVNWTHDTNPEMIEVSANHKASMIIDNILPQLSEKQRKTFMDKYPALSITYNPDGSLKTLEQVEREKQTKLNNLLTNGTDGEIQERATNVSKVYDTAIESHPVLCFEKCLQHIARLSWNSDRFFTDSGIEVKYNHSEVRKELRMAQAKAKAIASYIEDTNIKLVKAIFERYKKELMASPRFDQTSVRFFEEKKLAIYGIENQIYRNKEVKSIIEKDKESLHKRKLKHMQMSQAEEIIKKVFPNFKPYPQNEILKDGVVEISNNVTEKLMLMEAYKRYVRITTDTNSQTKQDKNFVASNELLSAIKTLYEFNKTTEEKTAFEEALKNEEIKIICNKYELQKSAVSSYSQDEIKSVEGRTFNWSPRQNDLSNEAQSTQYVAQENYTEAIQGQHQVATQRQQEFIEEIEYDYQPEYRNITKKELYYIKQQNSELDTYSMEEQIRQEELIRQQQEETKDTIFFETPEEKNNSADRDSLRSSMTEQNTGNYEEDCKSFWKQKAKRKNKYRPKLFQTLTIPQ